MNNGVNFVGLVPESSRSIESVTTTPARTAKPQQVRLHINNIDTVVPWQTFLELLNCCHEFETNMFPTHAKSGKVEVTLL